MYIFVCTTIIAQKKKNAIDKIILFFAEKIFRKKKECLHGPTFLFKFTNPHKAGGGGLPEHFLLSSKITERLPSTG